MSDDADTPPKVVRLATRDAYRPQDVPPDETTPAPGEPDPAVIGVLETMLAMAREGRLHGLVTLAWDPVAQEFWRHVTVPHLQGFDPRAAAAFLVGGMQLLDDDLKDIAFWSAGYDPLCVSRDEDSV